MHLAQPLIDGFQALADLGEAGVQLLFQAFRKPLVHRLAHFGQLALVLQTEGVDFLLLVPGGQEYLALHAFQQGGLALAHLGKGGHQVLVCPVQRIHCHIMLGVQIVQNLIGQRVQAVFLLQAVSGLLMGQDCLPDKQDDQQNQAGDQEECFSRHGKWSFRALLHKCYQGITIFGIMAAFRGSAPRSY